MRIKTNKNNTLSIALIAIIATACSVVPISKSTADVIDDVMAEFAQLEKSGSKVGQDWFSLAQKARISGSLDIASQALDRAASNGVPPIQIGVEKTRQYVAGDDSAAAVQELQRGMDAGFTSVAFITQDAVINGLAGRADYDALIAAMSVQAYPCQHMPGFRDFDFWIGEWDVAGANGTPAGSNSIQPAERGCVLIENLLMCMNWI